MCRFVREIVAARTGEDVVVTDRPEDIHRRVPAVEELWASSSRAYAVEHTRVESFEGQIGTAARLRMLLEPLPAIVADRIPGTYVFSVSNAGASALRLPYRNAQDEIVRLVVTAAPAIKVGERVALQSDALPLGMWLHRRDAGRSRLFLRTAIEGDQDELRLERITRALDQKIPKLLAWAASGRTSVLILESDDIQLANAFSIWSATQRALAGRRETPDIIVLVETDTAPMNGWVLKEGDLTGDGVPVLNGGRCYVEGQIRA